MFRIDCGHDVGYGHVMRCLMVADALKAASSFEPIFALSHKSDHDPVRAAGYPVIELSPEQSAISYLATLAQPTYGPYFLDSYSVETADLEFLDSNGFCVSIFEDGKRLDYYPCNLVIDPALNASNLGYRGSEKTNFCLGADYFPLRSEFRQGAPRKLRNGPVNKIIITLGGSDPNDQTMRVLNILDRMGFERDKCAILGPGYQGQAANKKGLVTVRNPSNMSELLDEADLVISAAGGTSMELAHLGLPMALIALADNQLENAIAIDKAGAGLYLGEALKISDESITNSLHKLINDDDRRRAYSKNGLKLIDGLSHKRISDQIDQAWALHQANLKEKV